jgi:hypothetical protein
VRSTGVAGRFACSFRTDLHFADVKDDCGAPGAGLSGSDNI